MCNGCLHDPFVQNKIWELLTTNQCFNRMDLNHFSFIDLFTLMISITNLFCDTHVYLRDAVYE